MQSIVRLLLRWTYRQKKCKAFFFEKFFNHKDAKYFSKKNAKHCTSVQTAIFFYLNFSLYVQRSIFADVQQTYDRRTLFK